MNLDVVCLYLNITFKSPLALPTIERDTVVRPLSDSFEFTVAYLPKQLDSTLKYEIPPVSVNDLYKDPFTEGKLQENVLQFWYKSTLTLRGEESHVFC